MNNKKRFRLGLTALLVIMVGVFWFLPDFIFSDGQKIKVTADRIIIPGLDTARVKSPPPKQEIRQVFEYGWDWPLDSCGGYGFLYQIKFEPLPEVNKPTKIFVKLKSCWDWKIRSEKASPPSNRQDPHFIEYASEGTMDFTQLEPKWHRPIKKGDIYEGSIIIVPREIGRHGICIAGHGVGELCFQFGFYENGELAHLSDRGSFPVSDLPNHPAITDKEIYVKFNGQYVTNLFHITPPLSLNDTSTVHYRVVPKVDYPEGLKLVTRDHKNIKFKMVPGPINKGDTLEGSFEVLPSNIGRNSIGLGIEEPPKEGIKPKNDSFIALYNLYKDGKLLYIVKNRKEYDVFYEYFKKKGVELEKF